MAGELTDPGESSAGHRHADAESVRASQGGPNGSQPEQAGPVEDPQGSIHEDEVPQGLKEEPQGLLHGDDLTESAHLSTVRYRIALWTLGILSFVVVAAFGILFASLWTPHASIDNLTRLLEILFAPLVALVGVALAFYYRST